MKKTLISLAIAAAMPVAAQADVTIFGRLTSKYKNTGAITLTLGYPSLLLKYWPMA